MPIDIDATILVRAWVIYMVLPAILPVLTGFMMGLILKWLSTNESTLIGLGTMITLGILHLGWIEFWMRNEQLLLAVLGVVPALAAGIAVPIMLGKRVDRARAEYREDVQYPVSRPGRDFAAGILGAAVFIVVATMMLRLS